MAKVIHFNNLHIYQRKDKESIKAASVGEKESRPPVSAKEVKGHSWRLGGGRGRSGNGDHCGGS